MPDSAFKPFVLGTYNVLRRLGGGGMGEVYLGEPVEQREAYVALKVVKEGVGDTTTLEKALGLEAKLSARLHHGNLRSVQKLDRERDRIFAVMEYVDGCDLGRLLGYLARKRRKLPPPLAVYVGWSVCRGLGALHSLKDSQGRSAGLVHRDVSPGNILVDARGVVKLGDLGVAGRAYAGSARAGKSAYSAPEVLAGKRGDQRSDVFSVGVVLWEGLTGRRLFKGTDDAAVKAAVANGPIPPPSTLEAKTTAEMEAVVLRALDRDPARRFPSAREMEAALVPCLAGNTARALGNALGRLMAQYVPLVTAEQRAALPRPRVGDAPLENAGNLDDSVRVWGTYNESYEGTLVGDSSAGPPPSSTDAAAQTTALMEGPAVDVLVDDGSDGDNGEVVALADDDGASHTVMEEAPPGLAGAAEDGPDPGSDATLMETRSPQLKAALAAARRAKAAVPPPTTGAATLMEEAPPELRRQRAQAPPKPTGKRSVAKPAAAEPPPELMEEESTAILQAPSSTELLPVPDELADLDDHEELDTPPVPQGAATTDEEGAAELSEGSAQTDHSGELPILDPAMVGGMDPLAGPEEGTGELDLGGPDLGSSGRDLLDFEPLSDAAIALPELEPEDEPEPVRRPATPAPPPRAAAKPKPEPKREVTPPPPAPPPPKVEPQGFQLSEAGEPPRKTDPVQVLRRLADPSVPRSFVLRIPSGLERNSVEVGCLLALDHLALFPGLGDPPRHAGSAHTGRMSHFLKTYQQQELTGVWSLSGTQPGQYAAFFIVQGYLHYLCLGGYHPPLLWDVADPARMSAAAATQLLDGALSGQHALLDALAAAQIASADALLGKLRTFILRRVSVVLQWGQVQFEYRPEVRLPYALPVISLPMGDITAEAEGLETALP